jgi:hypothetical protein
VQALKLIDVHTYPTFFTENGSIYCEHKYTCKAAWKAGRCADEVAWVVSSDGGERSQ